MRIPAVCLATLATFILNVAAIASDAPSAAAEGAAKPAAALADPIILLVRDESVRAELNLSDTQRRELDELLKSNNRALLAIRDVSPTGASESLRPALTELRQKLNKLFTDEQRQRLSSISLQAQGNDALLRHDVSTKLALTEKQRDALTAAGDKFRAASQEFRKANSGAAPEQLQEGLAKIQGDRHRQILEILDAKQQSQYGVMLGKPFDMSKGKASPADAPEFEGITEWMNSEPITMASLRGRVVVVHFFAFGCINCIHNYPWYKDWQERLTNKGVTLIGIHTPETSQETKSDLLKASLASKGLTFPVAVDKEKKMWDAWHNGIWPSVYIIDKRGRLRYWWYGELDWQGAGNQKVAERQIMQLLAE